MLRLSDIDDAERAVQNVRAKLKQIGREIYKMRERREMEPHFAFQNYERTSFPSNEYSGYEGPDWGLATPVFSLRFWWDQGEELIAVTFPQSWLENDWRSLEAERLKIERAAKAERERDEKEKASRTREEREKATYERLKAKFENT